MIEKYKSKQNLNHPFNLALILLFAMIPILLVIKQPDYGTAMVMLAIAKKKLKDKNTPIYICNPSSHAEKIFKMTGLYDIMPKIS